MAIEERSDTRNRIADSQTARWDGAGDPNPTVGDVVRLLSAGPTGAILLALGERPLRTRALTMRVPRYSPRTIYRYAGTLAQLHLLERREEAGVPSKVTYGLTVPFGREIQALTDSFAAASTARLPDGRVDGELWGRLEQLAELWDSGLMRALSLEGHSATELAMAVRGLTYHQIERRLHLFTAIGLVSEGRTGHGTRYELSEQARRGAGLVAGVGRWRRRYAGPQGGTGLTPAETATVLRAALPLMRLPEQAGRSLGLSVACEESAASGEAEETVWATVDGEGAIRCSRPGAAEADGWAHGRVKTWLLALLDGKQGRMHVGGDLELVDSALTRLHAELWPHVGRHGSGARVPV